MFIPESIKPDKTGKYSFTKEELCSLLDCAYYEGYRVGYREVGAEHDKETFIGTYKFKPQK